MTVVNTVWHPVISSVSHKFVNEFCLFKQHLSNVSVMISHLSVVILNSAVNIFVWQNNQHDDCAHENQTITVCCTITSCSFQRTRAIRQYDGHQRKQVAQQETSANQHLEKQEAGRKMKGIMWRKE